MVGSASYFGLDGDNGLRFAITGGYASPRNFASGDSIGSGATWSQFIDFTAFRYVEVDGVTTNNAPDFGAGSFMGFRTDSDNYGWLEVTWTSATNEFQILSGAYESVPNTPILAGQIVPEPSTVALGGVGALVCGGAALRRWRKQKRA